MSYLSACLTPFIWKLFTHDNPLQFSFAKCIGVRWTPAGKQIKAPEMTVCWDRMWLTWFNLLDGSFCLSLFSANNTRREKQQQHVCKPDNARYSVFIRKSAQSFFKPEAAQMRFRRECAADSLVWTNLHGRTFQSQTCVRPKQATPDTLFWQWNLNLNLLHIQSQLLAGAR